MTFHAKPPGKTAVTLLHHTRSVMWMGELISGAFGRDMVRFWRLEVEPERLAVLLGWAAWLHDLGKSNDQFQRYIVAVARGEPDLFNRHPMALRHETVSLWLACQEPIKTALATFLGEGERLAVLSAVASHHSKPFDPVSRDAAAARVGDRDITVPGGDPEFAALFAAAPVPFGGFAGDVSLRVRPGDYFPVLKAYSDGRHARLEGGGAVARLAGCLKSSLIAADVLGSMADEMESGGRDPIPLKEAVRGWAAKSFTRRDLDDMVSRDVRSIGRYETRPFQVACGASAARVTLMVQECAAGKTHAAHRWASRCAEGRRLFFCYPTRDTATSAYESLPDRDVCHLVHGLAAPPGSDGQEAAQERAEAFNYWSRAHVVCTVDTVLGLLSQYRRSVALAPVLANAAFVFDEVHGYDSRLFQGLLRFLREFDAPCLLMTASLTGDRSERLREAVRGLKEVRGRPLPAALAERYHKVRAGEFLPLVAERWGRGQRVLVVANTVDRAVAYADAVQDLIGEPVACYHSRYPHARREAIRNDLLARFGRGAGGRAVAVTTQIAQVSLNITCDLLVTDAAPACDLIQRLGRLNRWLGDAGDYVVLRVDGWLPYARGEVEAGWAWFESLPEHASQADLGVALEGLAFSDERVDAGVEHTLLDRFDSGIGRAREERAGLDVVLRRHAEAARAGRLAEYVVRMNLPYRRDGSGRWEAVCYRGWEAIGFAVVPPDGDVLYSEERGARWAT